MSSLILKKNILLYFEVTHAKFGMKFEALLMSLMVVWPSMVFL